MPRRSVPWTSSSAPCSRSSPSLEAARVRAALERGVARAASASLDTEGYRVVDLHLARVEATEESSERADILRSLSENLEERGDADRALVVRLSAFTEASTADDLDPCSASRA